jgi:large subunit ribosomal protein L22
MKSISQNLRISPKKINLIAMLVRNKNAADALDILRFTPKKGAKILYKAVKSAVKNAETNFKQDINTLFVKEIVVTKGMTLKRSVPISKGRVHPILKRCAHIRVIIGVNESLKPEEKKKGKKKEAATVAPAAETAQANRKPAKKAAAKKVKA